MRTVNLKSVLLALAGVFSAYSAHSADSFIGGTVSGNKGPEAGVWVIAETTDLPTRFIKIVVTDEVGKFMLPELPSANYQVWVRGYGLKDSTPTKAKPGDTLKLQAAYPKDAREAAQIYPAMYWLSLLAPPKPGEFPLGMAAPSQEAWIDNVKQNCQLCHQLGNRLTREVTHIADKYHTTKEAWSNRVNVGPYGSWMNRYLAMMNRERAIDMFADWTERIAKGELPPAPPRPQGLERNVVLTMWDWGHEASFVHDEVTTDKRNPRVNAGGPLYGVSESDGQLLIVDPNTHTAKALDVPMRQRGAAVTGFPPSYFYGSQPIFKSQSAADTHNPMMDHKGRVWLTARIRLDPNPDFCKPGTAQLSAHPSAQFFPLNSAQRHLSVYDPATEKFTSIDTCYATHHLQFASDANNTLWLSGDTQVVGWFDTNHFDKHGDEEAAQHWCPTVLDTNGDGQITKPWNEPGQAKKADRDTRTVGFAYGVIPNKIDGSVWFVRTLPTPGRLVRVDIGSNPPQTCKTEEFEPPFNTDKLPRREWGYGPRGIDITSDGVIWTALSGSSHLASFDRRKCKVLNGPAATGQHCAEGWTLYPAPGPKMKGVDSQAGADFHYYNWVDQFNTLGLGKNIPIATGTTSDSLLALDPATKKWVVLRVPYPLGFYSRGLDGRIDNPNAGWKGSAVYADFGTISPWHLEGGKGTKSKMVKFQLRPNPLAK